VVLLGSLLTPSLAGAQAGDEAFRRGLDARSKKQWAEMATQMRAAIKADPKESTRDVGGLVGNVVGFLTGGGRDYMPYFHLGDALLELGDCGSAVEAWLVSEEQGAVRGNRDFFTKLQSGLKACADKGVLLRAEFTQQQQTTRQAYDEAHALAQRFLNSAKNNNALWQQGDFETQYARVDRELQAGFKSLTRANTSRLGSDFKEAQAAIQRATATLRPLELRFNATIENSNAVQRGGREVTDAIAAAEAVDRSIDGFKPALTPRLAGSRQQALASLAQARERLKAGMSTSSQTALAEAAAHATSATKALQDVLDQARSLARGATERLLADAVAAATQTFAFIDSSFAAFDRLAMERPSATQPETSGQREALQKQVDALRRRFDRARTAEDVSGIRQTVQLASEAVGALDTLIKSFGPVTLRDRGVHAALEEGARFFFDGDYPRALDALSALSARNDVPLQLHVHLFRAAALYALFVRSGETDQALRAEALAEVERCRQLDSGFNPDPRTFSPRFIAFYRAGSVPAADAARQTPGSESARP
jgi:hypothetical protein